MKGISYCFSIFSIFVILIITERAAAQTAPAKLWDRVYGGDDFDHMYHILPTADGNYLLGGTSMSNVSGDKSQPSWNNDPPNFYNDYWIVKINAAGDKIWDKTFGGTGGEELNSIVATSDGGYLLAGSSWSGISGDKTQNSKGSADYWIVKIDAAGNKIWDKTIGGSGEDNLSAIVPTSDGGYLLGGYSSSEVSGDRTEAISSPNDYDYWIVKIDASGNKLWDKNFGGFSPDYLRSIISTTDGGYLLSGHSASGVNGTKTAPSNGDVDYWIVKIDAAGSKQWEKSFGGSGADNLNALIPAPAGGYLLGGESASGISGDKTEANRGNTDYWVVKIDATGNKQWDKTFGGTHDDILRSLVSTGDGGYLFGGSSRSGISGDKTETNRGWEDYWIVKTDASGSKQWDKTIGGNDEDQLNSIIALADGGYFLGGYTLSSVSGDKTAQGRGGRDFWLVKLAPLNAISTTALASSTLCAGSAQTVSFTATGSFSTGNVFTAQLSDASGSFLNPVTIGTLTSTALTGAISTTIPVGTISGNGYRIRIVASTPATTGSDNGTNLTIHPLPSAQINGATAICQEGNLSLSAAVAGAVYAWSGPNSFTAATQNITINNANSNHAGSYSLTVTSNGCSATASVNVAVNALPLAQTGASHTICMGNNITIGMAAVAGNTYSWTSNPSGFTSTQANPSVNPATTTTYTLTETITATGCSKTNNVVITVNAVPAAPSVTASGATTICQGNNVVLTASSASGNQWYKDGVAINGATAGNYQVAVSGVYTVTTTTSSCTSAPSAGVTVTVNPVPSVPTISVNGNVLTSSSATGNQWYLNGNAIDGATASTYTVQTSGPYSVQVTQNGCSAMSAVFNFVFTAVTGPSAWEVKLNVYPNPANKTLYINNTGLRHLRLQLVDMNGRSVYEGRLSLASGSIHVGELAGGTYLLLATDVQKNETVQLTIIKQ